MRWVKIGKRVFNLDNVIYIRATKDADHDGTTFFTVSLVGTDGRAISDFSRDEAMQLVELFDGLARCPADGSGDLGPEA